MKLLNESEALEVIDSLESRNLLFGQSRVLADIIKERRWGHQVHPAALRDGAFNTCTEETEVLSPDGNDEDHITVWSFDRIMSYLRISFMPQLAEVGV